MVVNKADVVKAVCNGGAEAPVAATMAVRAATAVGKAVTINPPPNSGEPPRIQVFNLLNGEARRCASPALQTDELLYQSYPTSKHLGVLAMRSCALNGRKRNGCKLACTNLLHPSLLCARADGRCCVLAPNGVVACGCLECRFRRSF